MTARLDQTAILLHIHDEPLQLLCRKRGSVGSLWDLVQLMFLFRGTACNHIAQVLGGCIALPSHQISFLGHIVAQRAYHLCINYSQYRNWEHQYKLCLQRGILHKELYTANDNLRGYHRTIGLQDTPVDVETH